MSLHAVDCDYAHRLATMLECALLNRLGSWDEGHALLDEYRAACRAAMPDAPTFMGEPVIDDVYTAELVEIDGNTYGLRPGAARIVKEALADDPELDGTDFAKPAWWRGEAYGSSAAIAAVTRILDGKDDGRGVANEPWQSVRTRLREALRDAERYRWLRDDGDGPDNAIAAAVAEGDNEHGGEYVSWLYGDELDDAIDAAMAKDGAQ